MEPPDFTDLTGEREFVGVFLVMTTAFPTTPVSLESLPNPAEMLAGAAACRAPSSAELMPNFAVSVADDMSELDAIAGGRGFRDGPLGIVLLNVIECPKGSAALRLIT